MPPQYGNRGSNVTIVVWEGEDGTKHLEAWSASGMSGRRASHMTAADRVEVLKADGVEPHLITTYTTKIQ